MIRSNLRLVINIAKQYSTFGVPLLDLIEEGNLGLMKAVSKFNHKLGYRFSTYAAWWIKQHVTRALADQGKTVRIPVYMVETLSRFKKVNERLTHRYRRKPKVSELARGMRVPVSKIRQLMQMDQTTTSLDQPVGTEGDASMMDLLEDPKTTNSQTHVDDFLRSERVESLLQEMNSREREILEMRFGLKDGEIHTLNEAAKRFKITRERVRQIEAVALRKLRQLAESQSKASHN
ncbi:MAG: sigma-70 family RNA polymerase sigma factor [Candidatus Omnitrophica bacterium]|nr:sigma-70 family RNA polymerase sigma factor [Candidatus Omnitrophota bacterium]